MCDCSSTRSASETFAVDGCVEGLERATASAPRGRIDQEEFLLDAVNADFPTGRSVRVNCRLGM